MGQMAGRHAAVSLLSGGLDSATLAYWFKAQGYELRLLSVHYGQRHDRELQSAAEIARALGTSLTIANLQDVGRLFSGSALTDDRVSVPEGHYAAETMTQTIVPNRNAILLSIAYGVAVAEGAEAVGAAVHAGDRDVYPDCRPEFIEQLGRALCLGNEWADPLPQLVTPFIQRSKADIVRIGAELGVPFALTWSCYKGGELHCGLCGTCVERREAFFNAGVEDPTQYEVSVAETERIGHVILHATPDE
jgi:7-cyano-7-deazaguanine synthase